jgi:hypothetical protein
MEEWDELSTVEFTLFQKHLKGDAFLEEED